MGSALEQELINEQLGHWESNFPDFAHDCLWINTKSGEKKQLELNKAQLYIHDRIEAQRRETGKVRAIILKGRQQGCSTYVEARYYWRTIFRTGVRAFILAHIKTSTDAIYDMAKRYHNNCPIAPVTGKSNAKELIFELLDTGYRVGTAGSDSVGRGTTLQYFHGSEVAFWAERNTSDLTAGIIQAVPNEDETEIIHESTANGPGNFFHQQTMLALRGESEYQLIFIPWYWTPEYTAKPPDDFKPSNEERDLMDEYKLSAGQITWRRQKIIELTTPLVDGEKKFKQEYPFNIDEAFQASGGGGFIKPELVRKARRAQVGPSGTLVVGVDPSRGGDRFAVMRRSGRKMYNPETHVGVIKLGRAVQICKKILDEEKPDRMFIDAGGGADLVDRLHELGYAGIVKAVAFGSAALDPERYKNKRAEMWSELARWLDCDDLPVQIPDSDEVQADFCAPQGFFDSADRFQLESKDHMINVRKIPSPDLGDAAALTFAENVLVSGASNQSFEPDME